MVERLSLKLGDAFGAMPGNVDAPLPHRRDGFRADEARRGARAFHDKPVAGVMAQQPFGHLAPRGIAGAQDQHPLFIRSWFSLRRGGPGIVCDLAQRRRHVVFDIVAARSCACLSPPRIASYSRAAITAPSAGPTT